MPGQTLRVLFLSQRNSARSMMAEAIANSVGRGQIQAFSAGVRPAGRVDPIAAELLKNAGLEVPDHPPQHVREFSAPDSPPLDFVFTLSDTAAGEAPPLWPGHRLRVFMSLPVTSLDRMSLQAHIDALGREHS